MLERCRESDVGFDASRLRNECFCSRATLDDFLADEVMALVLRSAGYQSDEFREMMTEMASKLVAP